MLQRSLKEVCLPELPDFTKSILGGSFRHTQDGSPGWISFQTRMPLIPAGTDRYGGFTTRYYEPILTTICPSTGRPASISDTSRETSRQMRSMPAPIFAVEVSNEPVTAVEGYTAIQWATPTDSFL
jgi:hypothetical protein